MQFQPLRPLLDIGTVRADKERSCCCVMIWEDKKYTTGDIARLYGMTLDAVRFYEKKGLLPADNKRDTKYRTYGRGDLLSMWQNRCLAKMGIPLADINKFVNNCSLEHAVEYLKEQVDVLNEEIQRLQRQYLYVTDYYEVMEELKSRSGKFSVEESAVFIGKDIKNGVVQAENWFQEHFGNMPTDLISVLKRHPEDVGPDAYSNTDYLKSARNTTIQIYLAAKCREEELSGHAPDFIWPAQTCIHTILKTNYDELDFSPIWQYAARHNYQHTGDTIVRLVFRERHDNKFTDYYEIWYAVE